MAISYPPAFINRYLQEKLAAQGFGATPMYPTMPTDFAISDSFILRDLIGDSQNNIFAFQGNVAIYDRMFKYRRKPFPHVKCEQLLYYFYAVEQNAVPNLIEMIQKIQDLLDREDESADELNRWLQEKQASNDPLLDNNGNELKTVFFHNMKVYHLEETRDIVDFGTARTYAGNKIIIDYDYHLKDYS